MDEEEEVVTFFDKNRGENESLLANCIRLLDEQIKWLKKKKKNINEEEEIQSSYNVSVYRVLPYPPNTKDTKDFFVQRS